MTAVASGRPIVSLARVTASGTRPSGSPMTGKGRLPAFQPGAPLVFTGIQAHQQLMDSFPWIDPENSIFVSGTRPAVPEGITLQSATVHGRLLISASFQPQVHRSARVRGALDAFATDPVGVLRDRP